MSFDASLLVIMGIFWVTYLILRVFFFKPMVALLEEREGRVATAQEIWEQATAETEARLADERNRLAETRRQAMNARAERRREAQERRIETLAEVKKSVQQELQQATAAIDRQVGAERDVLDQRSKDIAERIVRRLLGTPA